MTNNRERRTYVRGFVHLDWPLREREREREQMFILPSLQVSFMHQTTGDLLSVGSDLFIDDWPATHRLALKRFSARRLDLHISSVNENDSGLYTCMLNDEKLFSYSLEIFSKSRQDRLRELSADEREEILQTQRRDDVSGQLAYLDTRREKMKMRSSRDRYFGLIKQKRTSAGIRDRSLSLSLSSSSSLSLVFTGGGESLLSRRLAIELLVSRSRRSSREHHVDLSQSTQTLQSAARRRIVADRRSGMVGQRLVRMRGIEWVSRVDQSLVLRHCSM